MTFSTEKLPSFWLFSLLTNAVVSAVTRTISRQQYCLLLSTVCFLRILILAKFVQSYGFAICRAWFKLGHSVNFCNVFKRLFSLLANGIYATLRSTLENELFSPAHSFLMDNKNSLMKVINDFYLLEIARGVFKVFHSKYGLD